MSTSAYFKDMPYIPKNDHSAFEEEIKSLFEKLRSNTNEFRKSGHLRKRFNYVYYEINRKSMPARRYWVLAEHGGIMHNIPDEVRRRLRLVKPPRPPKKFSKYDALIDALTVSINRVAKDYNDKANPPGSYPGAYAGLVNFLLSTLFLRIMLDIAGRSGAIDQKLLKTMLKDMDKTTLAFYFQEAGPYEDEQIKKESNGDLHEYIEIRRLLGITD